MNVLALYRLPHRANRHFFHKTGITRVGECRRESRTVYVSAVFEGSS